MNVFRRTKNMLIVMYSGWIIAILAALMIVFYVILYNLLIGGTERQLKDTSDLLVQQWDITSVASELANPKRGLMLRLTSEESGLDLFMANAESYISYDFVPFNQFFILLSDDGTLKLHSLADGNLLIFLRDAVAQSPGSNTFLYDNDRSIRVQMRKLDNGMTLYTGTEVTDNIRFLRHMLWLLVLLAVVFAGLSVAMGYWFSHKAMIPIQRSYRRQQNFVSDASHELRTPLSIMQTSLEILEEEEQRLPDFHRKVLAGMKAELSRITRMTEELLLMARSDSGELRIHRSPFDLKAMAESTIDAFALLSGKQKIDLFGSVELPDDARMFNGDEMRLKQLLYILLDNAIKYNKPEGKIRLDVRRIKQDVLICVSDTGIGIPREEIPNIFERFYRVDKARSRSGGGAGLGLSIASWIVNAHGGLIQVESELNQGTTVRVRLPANATGS